MVKDYDVVHLVLTIIQLSNGAYSAEEISQIIEMIRLYEAEFGAGEKNNILQLFTTDEKPEH